MTSLEGPSSVASQQPPRTAAEDIVDRHIEGPLHEEVGIDILLSLYASVGETHRYEGEGIWSRFNILVGLHMALFAIVAFSLSRPGAVMRGFITAISIGGFLLALWAIYVLRRLWLWHRHWVMTLRSIEASLPPALPRPFTDRPAHLSHRLAWYQAWLLAYTQPFMMVLAMIWLALLFFVALTDFTPDPTIDITGNIVCDATQMSQVSCSLSTTSN